MTDLGPVSAFVRSMPGFRLLMAIDPARPRLPLFLLFACGNGPGHGHTCVAPGCFDRTGRT